MSSDDKLTDTYRQPTWFDTVDRSGVSTYASTPCTAPTLSQRLNICHAAEPLGVAVLARLTEKCVHLCPWNWKPAK
jgi:hypothetical protein